MNYNEVIQAIGSIGFPIVMCLLQYKLCNDSLKKVSEALIELKEAINNESKN